MTKSEPHCHSHAGGNQSSWRAIAEAIQLSAFSGLLCRKLLAGDGFTELLWAVGLLADDD